MFVKRPIAGSYENTIDILNQVYPVNMSDRGRLLLDYPVLTDVSAVAKDTPKGRLLRCNSLGNVLTGNSFKVTNNYTLSSWSGSGIIQDITIDFGIVVDYVLLNSVGGSVNTLIVWTDPSRANRFVIYNRNTCYFIPFKGQIMYFTIFFPTTFITVSLYGFFK